MKRVHRLMRRAVDAGVFPGGALLVSQRGDIRFRRAYGVMNLLTRRPATLETVFDLASLTKPLATTLAVMALTELGRLALDDPIGIHLMPLRGTDKSRITVRQLLSHRSGLPAYRPYFIPLSDIPPRRRQAALRDYVMREPLTGRPGECRLYSDIGFMVLQWLVEDISGHPLDRFAAEAAYRPMGCRGLFFPGLNPGTPLCFAATERCGWRQQIVEGTVHDENAWVMGGVAGHAGLFGTVGAVWNLLGNLTNIYKGRKQSGGFRPETVKAFFEGRKGWGPLGFDAPAPQGSSAGRFFGPRSIGHLGFTGTSFWVDPDRDVIVVLLTNRVHPSRKNLKIKEFRPILHHEIMKSLAGGS